METNKLLIIVGLALLSLGLILSYAPWLISWFGKLPGDIRIDHPDSRVFIPITSMLVVSLVLTLLANILGK